MKDYRDGYYTGGTFFELANGPLNGNEHFVLDIDIEDECFPFTLNGKEIWYCRNQQGKPLLEFEESFTK